MCPPLIFALQRSGMSDDLRVVRLRRGPFWNNSYLIGSPATGAAVAIDPAWDVPAMLAAAREQGLRIVAAAVTHAHHDHAHGLAELVAETGAAVYIHERDAAGLEAVYSGPLCALGHDHMPDVAGLPLRLLHTPGHTPGSASLLVGEALFTGDTLMVGALGRAGPDAGAEEDLWQSVRSVYAALPGSVVLYPGHDAGPRPDSTLAEERRANPALTAPDFATFLRLLRASR